MIKAISFAISGRDYKNSFDKRNSQSIMLQSKKVNNYSNIDEPTLLPENYFLNTKFNNEKYIINSNRIKPACKTVLFKGKIVHIVDGGNHATNMEHFSHAISNSMDTVLHLVEINPKDKNIKQLKSLESKLKQLNSSNPKFDDIYIAIPALASVPLLNLQDQYKQVMKEDKKFTPENIKSNKINILKFLQKIYSYPETYRNYINYMDPNKQGIEFAYGVIREINEIKRKGGKVYIPSGHPQDTTLKWMAGQKGLKPELYHYIATGEDKGGCIEEMHRQIKDKNWYDFNLLSLSEANVVGVKGTKGAQDYMFAAYDSCVNDGARGVYNFSPVRNGDELIGYSYNDTSTNEYPFNEFPANDEIENIVKFVGKPAEKVIATKSETNKFKNAILNNSSTFDCADKLYLIKDVFPENYITKNKLDLQGEFIDKSLKLIFSKNSKNEIIFPKCDCEGSGKPSVLSMWGSCFAVFNAIARDIDLEKTVKIPDSIASHLVTIKFLKSEGERCRKNGYKKAAEDYFNNAIAKDKAFLLKNTNYISDFEPHYLLGNLHYSNGNYVDAASCYNNAIGLLSKKIEKDENTDLQTIKRKYDAYVSSKSSSQLYDSKIRQYNLKSPLRKLFSSIPVKPYDYEQYKHAENDLALYNKVIMLSQMFEKLKKICEMKGEDYPAKICDLASSDIKNCTQRGNNILSLRSQGIHYIGDLYPEIECK